MIGISFTKKCCAFIFIETKVHWNSKSFKQGKMESTAADVNMHHIYLYEKMCDFNQYYWSTDLLKIQIRNDGK